MGVNNKRISPIQGPERHRDSPPLTKRELDEIIDKFVQQLVPQDLNLINLISVHFLHLTLMPALTRIAVTQFHDWADAFRNRTHPGVLQNQYQGLLFLDNH
jgi:hypothetical protein